VPAVAFGAKYANSYGLVRESAGVGTTRTRQSFRTILDEDFGLRNESRAQRHEIPHRAFNRTLEVWGSIPPRLHRETKTPRRDTRRFCFR